MLLLTKFWILQQSSLRLRLQQAHRTQNGTMNSGFPFFLQLRVILGTKKIDCTYISVKMCSIVGTDSLKLVHVIFIYLNSATELFFVASSTIPNEFVYLGLLGSQYYICEKFKSQYSPCNFRSVSLIRFHFRPLF